LGSRRGTGQRKKKAPLAGLGCTGGRKKEGQRERKREPSEVGGFFFFFKNALLLFVSKLVCKFLFQTNQNRTKFYFINLKHLEKFNYFIVLVLGFC
jgi:hypothetical protein